MAMEKEVERMARERLKDPKYQGPPAQGDFARALPSQDAKRAYLLSSSDLKAVPHLPISPNSNRAGEKLYLPEDLNEFAVKKYGEIEFHKKREDRDYHDIRLQRDQKKEAESSARHDINSKRADRKILRHKIYSEKHHKAPESPEATPGI